MALPVICKHIPRRPHFASTTPSSSSPRFQGPRPRFLSTSALPRSHTHTDVPRRAKMAASLKVPAWRRTEITARAVVAPDDGLDGVKMVTGPGLLRKRVRSELEVVRGLVQKAARLVAVDGSAAAAPTNAGKKERFLAAEAPSATGRGGGGAKRRKTTSPVVEVIQPRMSSGEREHLVTSLTSLSLDLPSHIIEFMQRKCGAVMDGGEMEINIDSAGDASLLQLKKLVDEFAVEWKKRGPRKDEDVAASGAMSNDEFVDICGDASPVAVETKPAAAVAAEPLELKIAAVQQEKRAAPPSLAPAPAGRIGDLIAKAQQEKRMCLLFLRDERKRAREELLEMERTAMPDDRIHPLDMVRLHIAEVEHVVSSGDKISPVRQLGLVMK